MAYLLLVAHDLGILVPQHYEKLKEEYDRVAKMLTMLIKSLRID